MIDSRCHDKATLPLLDGQFYRGGAQKHFVGIHRLKIDEIKAHVVRCGPMNPGFFGVVRPNRRNFRRAYIRVF